ncbi:helicase-related protein [Streptomyces sp. NPDC056835]|uniref:helicase-related protein n=1 Tax=Streptomyces sp. NPDC056835 TaxID=3345956 RepID=UPI00368BD9B3
MTSGTTTTSARRAPGDLVSARGRDWVVQPSPADEADGLVIAQPLDGDREYLTALFPHEIKDPGFGPPEAVPGEVGDFASAGLLRTALRIAATHGAGPFRSLASISVQPRQYQLVPLMMALRMDTVRLLIGDDVGIGKTVEAALIAKELIEQGSARNMAVLCSPSLAEQWQRELREKFGMDAVLVLPSTAARLEKTTEQGQSIFDRYPCTVVSTDFIKQEERRGNFKRTCPDILIVDEAHSCVGTGTGHQLRYELLRELAADADRHLVLVTATPHSGDVHAFAKLTGLLDPALQNLDPTLPAHRDRLARHFVQRRRRDIKRYLDEETPFPRARMVRETPYHLDKEYAGFVTDVLTYAREQVRRPDGAHQQRMTWVSVLALLRCVLSSPAAAAETLRVRAGVATAHTDAEIESFHRAVLDLTDDESVDGQDGVPGSLLDTPENSVGARKLKSFAARADQLSGPAHDAKLRTLVDEVKGLLVDGYDPIVFCRYVPTAEYVAGHLAKALGRSAHVDAVTGKLHPDARQARIDELTAKHGRHVLVATDCLSEGVNLQDDFGAVLHYDLSWNPTRHEQREGRVDRFGQARENVRAVTLFDTDTGIDGLVLDVLIRKHQAIAEQVGVVVPVPDGGEGVLKALSSSLFLRGKENTEQLTLDIGTEALFSQARERLHKEWEDAADRESKVLTKFAQSGLRPEEVQAELNALRQALGEPADIADFTRETLKSLGSPVRPDPHSTGFTAPAGPLPRGLRHGLGIYEDHDQATGPGVAQAPARGTAKGKAKSKAKTGKAVASNELVFHQDLPVPAGQHALFRTDPAVRAVARYVLDSALDRSLSEIDRPARRLGVIRTAAVDHRVVLLLVRYRFHLTLPPRRRADRTPVKPRELVAEDAQLLAWRTTNDGTREWLTDDETAELLPATPDRNTIPSMRDQQISRALEELDEVKGDLASHGHDLARRLEAAHLRVREAAGERGRARGAAAARGITAEPAGEPDLLGVYVYVKRPGGSR